MGLSVAGCVRRGRLARLAGAARAEAACSASASRSSAARSALRDALGASEKPSDLLETLGVRLDALLAPNCTVIYAAAGDELAPVFVRGPAAAPSFGLERPLAVQLAAESGPTAVPARRRHPFWRALAADEASALEAMGAALLVPLRPQGALRRLRVPRREALGRRLHRAGSRAAREHRREGLRRAGALPRAGAARGGARDERAPATLRARRHRRGARARRLARAGRARGDGAVRGHARLRELRGAALAGGDLRGGERIHAGGLGGGPRGAGHRGRVQRRRHDGGVRRA